MFTRQFQKALHVAEKHECIDAAAIGDQVELATGDRLEQRPAFQRDKSALKADRLELRLAINSEF